MRHASGALGWGLALLLSALAWLHAVGDVSLPGVRVDNAQMREFQGAWIPLDTKRLATWPGPFELRWRLTLDQHEPTLGLRLAFRGAGELRCNGQLVLRNGRPAATASDEVPGFVDRWAVLPPLSAGTHELTLNGSSHQVPPQRFAATEAMVLPIPFEAMPRLRFARWLVVSVAWGALALTWLYFLRIGSPSADTRNPGNPLNQGNGERGTYWSLVALGTTGLLLPLAESARDLWGYAYPLHLLRLQTVLASTVLAAWLLPLSLALRWGWPRRPVLWSGAWALSLLLVVAVVLPSYGYDVTSWWLHLMGLTAALCLAWHARHHVNQSLPALLTLLAIALALMWLEPAAFLDGLYTVALSMVMMLLMLVHARLQQERASAEAAQRQALQTQLLRASMQPHGLMNTLAVLQELIEQHPALASRLVERLADQFNLLRVLSQKAQVSLREELELVRTQLDLVGMARGMPVALTVSGPVDRVQLPPGVLHTLVENAITHGGVRAGAPAFALQIDGSLADRWCIQLLSPRGAGRDGGTGQGQRFVRESLAGAYGTAWAFEGRPLDDAVWQDSLRLPRR